MGSELQDLIDPLAKLRDARVNSWLIGRSATDSPADDPSKDPPLVSRSLDDHRTTAVALERAEGSKLGYVIIATSYVSIATSFHDNNVSLSGNCHVCLRDIKMSKDVKRKMSKEKKDVKLI